MHSINDALSVLVPDWSLDEVEVIEYEVLHLFHALPCLGRNLQNWPLFW